MSMEQTQGYPTDGNIQDYTVGMAPGAIVGTYRVPVIDLRTGESMGTYRKSVYLLDRAIEDTP